MKAACEILRFKENGLLGALQRYNSQPSLEAVAAIHSTFDKTESNVIAAAEQIQRAAESLDRRWRQIGGNLAVSQVYGLSERLVNILGLKLGATSGQEYAARAKTYLREGVRRDLEATLMELRDCAEQHDPNAAKCLSGKFLQSFEGFNDAVDSLESAITEIGRLKLRWWTTVRVVLIWMSVFLGAVWFCYKNRDVLLAILERVSGIVTLVVSLFH